MLSINTITSRPNLDWLKKDYISMNKLEQIDKLYNKNRSLGLKQYYEYKRIFPLDTSGLRVFSSSLTRLEEVTKKLKTENIKILLYPVLKNAREFNFSKDIGDFISHDPDRVQAIYFNEQNGEFTELGGLWKGWSGSISILSGKQLNNTKRFFSFIKEEKPDAIFHGGQLFSSDDFLYIKNGAIFIYKIASGEVFELNEYIRKNEDEKYFIKVAVREEQGGVRFRDPPPCPIRSLFTPIREIKIPR